MQQSQNHRVFGDAKVFDVAEVSGDVQVFGDAWVFGDAEVFGGRRSGATGSPRWCACGNAGCVPPGK